MSKHNLDTEKFEYNRSNKPLYFAVVLLVLAIIGLGYFLLFTEQGQELLNSQNSLTEQNQIENGQDSDVNNTTPELTDNSPILDFSEEEKDDIIDQISEEVLTMPKSEEVDILLDIDAVEEFDT
jgi:predicted PurR-regulated permease PerM